MKYCGSIIVMVALRSRCGYYIFPLLISSCRLDVYHTFTHGVAGPSVNLEYRSEM